MAEDRAPHRFGIGQQARQFVEGPVNRLGDCVRPPPEPLDGLRRRELEEEVRAAEPGGVRQSSGQSSSSEAISREWATE